MLCKYYRLKRGQIALEFMMLIGLVFFVFLIFLGIILYNLQDLNKREELADLEDVALKVQNELNLATSVNNGYSRDFTLPAKVNGRDYSISQGTELITFETNKYFVSKRIPVITGTVQKGTNTITKQGGVINVS